MGLALVGYVVYPTAPPRVFPELGFTDSVAQFTHVSDTSSVNALFNPYAAVPSMHVCFALMIGWSMVRIARRALGPGVLGGVPAADDVRRRDHGQPLALRRRDGRARGRGLGRLGRADRPHAPAGLGLGSPGGAPRSRPGGVVWRPHGHASRRAPARPPHDRGAVPGALPQPAHRVPADPQRDLAHGLRAVRGRRRADLQGVVDPRRDRVHRRLGVRHDGRPLLPHVGQGVAVRRVPGLDARPHRGGRRARRRRRLLLPPGQRPGGRRDRAGRARLADGVLHPRPGRGARRGVQGGHRRPARSGWSSCPPGWCSATC